MVHWKIFIFVPYLSLFDSEPPSSFSSKEEYWKLPWTLLTHGQNWPILLHCRQVLASEPPKPDLEHPRGVWDTCGRILTVFLLLSIFYYKSVRKLEKAETQHRSSVAISWSVWKWEGLCSVFVVWAFKRGCKAACLPETAAEDGGRKLTSLKAKYRLGEHLLRRSSIELGLLHFRQTTQLAIEEVRKFLENSISYGSILKWKWKWGARSCQLLGTVVAPAGTSGFPVKKLGRCGRIFPTNRSSSRGAAGPPGNLPLNLVRFLLILNASLHLFWLLSMFSALTGLQNLQKLVLSVSGTKTSTLQNRFALGIYALMSS